MGCLVHATYDPMEYALNLLALIHVVTCMVFYWIISALISCGKIRIPHFVPVVCFSLHAIALPGIILHGVPKDPLSLALFFSMLIICPFLVAHQVFSSSSVYRTFFRMTARPA